MNQTNAKKLSKQEFKDEVCSILPRFLEYPHMRTFLGIRMLDGAVIKVEVWIRRPRGLVIDRNVQLTGCLYEARNEDPLALAADIAKWVKTYCQKKVASNVIP